jgi:HK97 family phage major capsid protein
MNDYINRQVEIRARAWGEAKALLDHAAAEGRDLTAAETEQYDRINAELDERTAVIDSLMKDQEREVRAAELRVPATTETRVAEKSDTDILRELVSGERRSYTFEKRQMTTANNTGVVPQGFYDVMQEILRYTGPALDPASGYTVLNTASGEEIKVPVQSTFSTATATAEGAAFAVNNPTTTSFGLKAYKFGTLVTVSRELLQDSGIDIEAFIARQAGNDLGRIINVELATGTGSTRPTGIVHASGSGITGGTAVGGAFTTDNLIDLVHWCGLGVRQPSGCRVPDAPRHPVRPSQAEGRRGPVHLRPDAGHLGTRAGLPGHREPRRRRHRYFGEVGHLR